MLDGRFRTQPALPRFSASLAKLKELLGFWCSVNCSIDDFQLDVLAGLKMVKEAWEDGSCFESNSFLIRLSQ